MKTFWKVLGAAAVVASLTPYSYNKNAETGEQALQALLWKLSSKPDPENENKSAVELSFGLHLPSPCKKAAEDIFAQDLTVTYHTAPACTCTCGDSCTCEDECTCSEGSQCCCQSEESASPVSEDCCEEGPCCEECCQGCCDETAQTN